MAICNKDPTCLSMDEITRRKAKKIVREKLNNVPKFKSFLEENKIMGRYIKNLINQKEDRIVNTNGEYIEDMFTSSCIIDHSFTWRHTSEGHDFWARFNSEYIFKKSIY